MFDTRVGNTIDWCGLYWFFGVIARFVETESRVWRERLYGLLSVCTDLGLLPKTGAPKAPPPAAPDAGEIPSVRKAKEMAWATKKAHKHAVYNALCFYDDLENLYQLQIIADIGDPLYKWHQNQNRRLRTVPASAQWLLEQCGGEFSQHIRATLQGVHSQGRLRAWGLETDFDASEADDVHGAHCAQQDFLAGRVGNFALSLARQRMSWGLDIISSWPKRCVLLTELASSEQQKHALDEFKGQIEIVRQALASEVPLMKAWALRSHLALTSAVQAKAILEGDGWKLTPRSREFFLQRSLRLMGTQVLEDGFKAMKQTSKKNPTQRISDFTAYHTLSEKKVLTKIHHFEDPPEQGGATMRGDTLNTSAFTFAKDNVWSELKGIRGFGEPKWHSPKGEDVNQSIGDIATMSTALAQKKELLLPKMVLWSGLLLQRMLVRLKPDPKFDRGHGWFFVLGRCSAACHFGFPARRKTFSGTIQDYFEFDTSEKEPWHPIVLSDYKEWEVLTYEWASPYHQWLLHRDAAEVQPLQARVRAMPLRGKTTLLQAAARVAFGKQSKSWLVDIAVELHCEVDKTASLFSVLWTLVQFVLEIPDDEVLPIVHLRVKSSGRHDDVSASQVTQIEGFRDHFTKDEQKMVQQQEEAETSAKKTRSSMLDEYKAMKTAVREAKAALAAPKKKAKAKKEEDPLKMLKVLAAVPPGSITQTELKQMLPPGAFVWNNWKGGAWCCHVEGHQRFSAPWLRFGHRDAALHCAREAWRMYLDDCERPLTDCPVKDLFAEE